MTDELTPEEREALRNLPRERMPAGLEARVVEAMRGHGFLAPRRRTIAITTGRVAGVVAAGVALMIGAYSIGLHRSGGDAGGPPTAVVPPMATRQENEGGLATRALPEKMAGQSAVEPAREAAGPAVADAEAKRAPETPVEESAPAPPVRSDEAVTDRARQAAPEKEARAAEGREATPAAADAVLPPAAPERSATQFMRSEPARKATRQPLTFWLDGSPLTVEADSVRVMEDEQGRLLIIYTPDGVMHIRLAD